MELVVSEPARWKERTAELAVGFTANALFDHAFDLLLYPFVIYHLGVVVGGCVMAALSFVVCLLWFRVYDWSARDWLGIEWVKQQKEYGGPSRTRRWFGRLLVRGDWVALIALSIKFDPFITTVYLRHGAFTGLSRRDWRHFLLSWLLGNAYWIAICFGGVSAFRWVREVVWP